MYFYHKLQLEVNVYMQATSDERNVVDIQSSLSDCQNIVDSILAAHAFSGCNTVAHFFSVGKVTIVSKLCTGKELKLLGEYGVHMEDILSESALLIGSCYGFQAMNMTECRIQTWYKTSKSRKTAPPLCDLPPTIEAFAENVKHTHFQTATWLSTMSPDPPDSGPTSYGWERDEVNRLLSPTGIPPAQSEVLKLVRCTSSFVKTCCSEATKQVSDLPDEDFA